MEGRDKKRRRRRGRLEGGREDITEKEDTGRKRRMGM